MRGLNDRAIVLLALGQTFAWAGIFYTFPALLLRWEQGLGWTKSDLTAAITLAILISGLAAPISGKIIDAGYGAIMMAGSAVLGGIGLILLSNVNTLWQFYGVWALLGITMAGCLYVPCFAVVTRARGKDAKQGIIFITLVAGFASTISFPLANTLSQELGWRASVAIFGLMVIILAAPALWFGTLGLERTRQEDNAPTVSVDAHPAFLRNPAFWFLAIGLACVAVVHGAILNHFLSILHENGVSSKMAVLAASFIGPMQIAGRLAMMASDRFISHHGVTVTAFILMAVSVVLLMIIGMSPAFLIAFVILFGSANGIVSILRPLIAQDILGAKNFGAKSGALALPYLVGSASGPYLGSIVWNFGGYALMLGILVALAALGCVMYLIAHRISINVQVDINGV